MSEVWDLAVIGGGAAGFFGAIACAEARPGARVLILEKSGRVLQKVEVSGGGRCNVTHDCPDPARMATHYPRGHRELVGPLHRFGVREAVAWFERRGVVLKTEADGRMFPTTDDSRTVIDCLETAAARAGVVVRTSAPVREVTPLGGAPGDAIDAERAVFSLQLHDGTQLRARQLLVATGGTRTGSGAAIARLLGHSLTPAIPSLFTFHIDDARIEGLSGLSVEHARVTVPGESLEQEGALLITHWGMSGPAILKLSAWGARELHRLDYHFDLTVNWLPGVDIADEFHRLRHDWGKRHVAARTPFDALPRRLWEQLVQAAGIAPEQRWAELSKAQGRELSAQLTRARFAVRGKSTHKDEFVTCGGVVLDEVDLRTFQSKLCPGVYFAGEVLDVDGITGGFNFQNAWTTAYLAGRSAAGA